ncbi:MAG: FHA domain-containing protein [Verrucomicrobia bacterium]|nr:FHA domain-containing protein [Verrucomicrobiota bacterium]
MAKLVVSTQGLTDRSCELKTELVTVGRVDDNIFQIDEASVSSHHCEILLRGTDVIIKDLGSTNGTFINGEKITEGTLKPGQTLRVGNVELRLDGEGLPVAKKTLDQTKIIPRGVQLNQLEQAGSQAVKFDKNPFAKKNNKTTKIFVVTGIVVGIVCLALFFITVMKMSGNGE